MAEKRHRCCFDLVPVVQTGPWGSRRCEKHGTILEGDSWYCPIHAPSQKKKRRVMGELRYSIMQKQNEIEHYQTEIGALVCDIHPRFNAMTESEIKARCVIVKDLEMQLDDLKTKLEDIKNGRSTCTRPQPCDDRRPPDPRS